MNNTSLWRALGRNTIISIILFGALLGLLWCVEWSVAFFQLSTFNFQLLRWSDPAWVVGIPASIIGVAYILTIRDPQNYTGFYAGIVMSALLGVQFILQQQYDSAVLYYAVFIPFQILSIVNWRKPKPASDAPFVPEYLSSGQRSVTLLITALIIAADYLLCTYVFQHDALTDHMAVKFFNGLLIASSVFANYWLIYRKIDAWFYWVAYSIAGIALFIIIGNIFSIVLFTFFLVINGAAGIAWIRLRR
ncbi:MAG: nicotinamide mononucleotide transporter [Paludibacteraceae bacterium]|nr:nicotinamide mononucleotide transporter [Paludibacteraceae bacterium]